jgi:hypothetical protein
MKTKRRIKSNPVELAIMRRYILEEVASMHRTASLHAYMGDNEPLAVHVIGRLSYIVCHAAERLGFGFSPEARIIAGMASALGDMGEHVATLQSQRGALIAGLAAVDRLLPSLTPDALAEGAFRLNAMLASPHGLTLKDFQVLKETIAKRN